MGVMIDAKSSFKEQLEHACQKGASATVRLAKLLPKVGRQKHCCRLRITYVGGDTYKLSTKKVAEFDLLTGGSEGSQCF